MSDEADIKNRTNQLINDIRSFNNSVLQCNSIQYT